MMSLLWTLLLLAMVSSYTQAATTPEMPSTTHAERTEYDSFKFQFDGATGMMTVRSMDKCYIWQLTNKEHQQIHTDDGLRNVELRLVKEIDNAYFTVVPKSLLNPNLINACTRLSTHYYLVH